MCRSIKRLRQPAGAEASQNEIEQAARQFVRKISGIQHPSSRTEAAFDDAVEEIATIATHLLLNLPPLKRPRQASQTEETVQ